MGLAFTAAVYLATSASDGEGASAVAVAASASQATGAVVGLGAAAVIAADATGATPVVPLAFGPAALLQAATSATQSAMPSATEVSLGKPVQRELESLESLRAIGSACASIGVARSEMEEREAPARAKEVDERLATPVDRPLAPRDGRSDRDYWLFTAHGMWR